MVKQIKTPKQPKPRKIIISTEFVIWCNRYLSFGTKSGAYSISCKNRLRARRWVGGVSRWLPSALLKIRVLSFLFPYKTQKSLYRPFHFTNGKFYLCRNFNPTCNKKDFGKIKLTVGVLKGSRQKIQYCITAIENG